MNTELSAVFEGSCACGAVQFRAQGAPKRAGLCHCRTCQKVHGSAFNAFAVFDESRVQIRGNTARWESSPGYTRLACAVCSSTLGGLNQTEIELSFTLFDTPDRIAPQYESWTRRRVGWLTALPLPQYPEHRVLAELLG
jgi:hypothetical protein